MGKNRKNKNLNKFVVDDVNQNEQNEQNEQSEAFQLISNKKKNVFKQLASTESNSDNEYCDECGNSPYGVHSVKEPVKKVVKEDDFYFSQGYHADDYENDYEKAITFYKLSMENDSEYYTSVASYNLGLIYSEKLNDNVKAEHYYKISCEKKYADAYYNLGLMYFNQKKYSDALNYLEKSINFGKIDIYYEYAFCLEKTGQKDKAFKYLQYHLMLKNASINEKKLWKHIVS